MLTRRVILVLLALFLTLAPIYAEDESETVELGSDADSSLESGLLPHSEHWVDLILAQGGSKTHRQIEAFSQLTLELLEQAEKGLARLVNEKIDGSPAIVFGFDKDGVPFVTYKRYIKNERIKDNGRAKGKQLLFRTEAEARAGLKGKPVLAAIFGTLIKELSAGMSRLPKRKYANLLFQGDLLFTPHGNRIERNSDCVLMQPNLIEYKICQGQPFFEELQHAKVGFVLHTVSKRVFGKDGRLYDGLGGDFSQVEDFTKAIRSKDVFAITPWHTDLPIAKKNPLRRASATRVRKLLEGIQKKIDSLNPKFQARWHTHHESRFRVFFNSELYPERTGGIYQQVADGRPFDFAETMKEYVAWIEAKIQVKKTKEIVKYRENLEQDAEAFAADFENLLQAYYDAILIDHLIYPSFAEGFVSILGGGEAEGMMLRTDDSVVKFVNGRLNFTRRNFAKKRRPGAITDFSLYPEPFDEWRPDSVFIVMKTQPFHKGHADMIKETIRLNPDKQVFVIFSDKEPDLKADNYLDLGVAENKEKTIDGEYTHPFNNKIRKQMAELGLGNIPFYMTDTSNFISYVGLAHSLNLPGFVYLGLGQKEEGDQSYEDEFDRYAPHLLPLYTAMQAGGISGTDVRNALAVLIDPEQSDKHEEKRAFLDRAMGMIEDDEQRAKICEGLIRQYAAVDKVAKKVTYTPPKPKKTPAKKAAKKASKRTK